MSWKAIEGALVTKLIIQYYWRNVNKVRPHNSGILVRNLECKEREREKKEKNLWNFGFIFQNSVLLVSDY